MTISLMLRYFTAINNQFQQNLKNKPKQTELKVNCNYYYKALKSCNCQTRQNQYIRMTFLNDCFQSSTRSPTAAHQHTEISVSKTSQYVKMPSHYFQVPEETGL